MLKVNDHFDPVAGAIMQVKSLKVGTCMRARAQGKIMARRPVEYLFCTAKKWGEKEFLHIPAYLSGKVERAAVSYSYNDAVIEVMALATRYSEHGITAGMRVGLMLENSADFFLHWLALNELCVAIVPLNKELAAEDCAHIIRDSQLCLITCFSDLETTAREALKHVGARVDVWSMETSDLSEVSGVVVAEIDECALLYTSGSTGLPKGCVLTNEYFEIAGQEYRDLGGLCALEEGKERLATPLPMAHMNALACSTMAMIMTGGCIIQLDRFHPKTYWQDVVKAGATAIHYLGVMPAILLQLPECDLEKQHTIKFAFGAGVNPKHHKVFEQRFGFPLVEAWSMTEVGGAAWVVANEEPRHVANSCFGKATQRMEYRIVDSTGADVPAGISGELLVRRAGSNPRKGFFAGYYGQRKLTEEAWVGGWFHTGDIVKADAQNSLYFVDRKKSIIRRSGENISALEVEAALIEHPGIKAIGVTPVPDDIRGEEVMACIVVGDGHMNTGLSIDIVRYALQKLAYFKVPGYVAFINELPLTPSQKLQRGELKVLARHIVRDNSAYDLRSMKKRSKVS